MSINIVRHESHGKQRLCVPAVFELKSAARVPLMTVDITWKPKKIL